MYYKFGNNLNHDSFENLIPKDYIILRLNRQLLFSIRFSNLMLNLINFAAIVFQNAIAFNFVWYNTCKFIMDHLDKLSGRKSSGGISCLS